MKVTILGCGSSTGVPAIGCDCAVCTSANPKNKRTRVSVLVETEGKNLLIDSSPDLRQQALAANLRRVHAVLYTHEHADHTHGIDDLRSFNYLSGGELPVYGDAETLAALQERFGYAFKTPKPDIWYRPCLIANILPDKPIYQFNIAGITITSFEQLHGKFKTIGYRVGDFAYSTDTDVLPEAAFEALKGIKIWAVDCLRYANSYSHSNLENTLKWVARVKPELAVLTHMSHELEYDKLAKELPPGVVPAYDGMVLEIQ